MHKVQNLSYSMLDTIMASLHSFTIMCSNIYLLSIFSPFPLPEFSILFSITVPIPIHAIQIQCHRPFLLSPL